MSLTTTAHSYFSHDDYPSVTSPRPSGYGQGHSMDVTASTLHRTSPLDFDFAKIQPFVKSGMFLEPRDTTAFSSNESRQPAPSKRNNRSAMRFSSNAGIIEEYARSWNSQDISTNLPHDDEKEFEQLVIPRTADNTPRWPFINDDSLNTPDSVDAEPLFPSSRSTVSHPRQIHRIDEDMEELAALYVAPLDAVPETLEAELPPPPPPPPPPARLSNRRSPGKVMTSAEFESFRRRKVLEETERLFYEGENEEDRINYDMVDEVDLAKKQMTQRKRQQVHLDSYRQQMMKTTKGHELPPMRPHSRISSTFSFKATVRGHRDEVSTQYGDDNEDEDDVPLALLQMKQRSEGREAPMHTADGRPEYGVQLQPAPETRRQQPRSPMPAFASKLPRDPFAGNANPSWPMSNQQPIPGGLVGVIANEERAKAMRRAAPSHGFQPLLDTNNAFNWASASRQPPPIPSAYGMQMTQPPMPYSRPQTPVAVPHLPPAPANHQMFNFIQAQTEFFRSMATINQKRSGQPWDNFSSQQSVMSMGVPSGIPSRAPSNYAPSNYAPSNYASSNYARSTYARSNYAKSVNQRDGGYAASVAPSERNTVGMPSRYRPVSKTAHPVHAERDTQASARVSTSSDWNHNRNARLDTRAILEADTTDSDDDEAFWRARKAKRDRRRAMCFQDNDLGMRPEWIR